MDFSAKLANRIYEFVILVQSLGKKDEYICKINNFSFYIRKNTSDKFIIDEIWKHKVYNTRIKKEDNIVDLGANIGSFTVLAAKKAINGKVFAFEPEYSNYQQLVKNVNLNKLTNTFCYRLGIAHKKCTLPLFLSDINKGASSIHETSTKKIEKINCVPLKSIFKLCNIKKIDLLKMDIEGAEYGVLFSTPEYVFQRINSIILEFHDFLNLKCNHKKLITFLEKKGFKISMCSPRKYISPRVYARLFKQGIIIAVKQI